MPNLSTAQGRYTILDSGPVIDPARCGVCGYGGKDRLYLDLRLDFEFYGTLIFCEECVASMASMFGFIVPAQAQALEARVEEAERELVQLRSAVAAVEAFRAAIGDRPSGDVIAHVSGSSSVADVNSQAGDSGASELPRAEGLGSKPVDKPAGLTRRNDLRDADASDRGKLAI